MSGELKPVGGGFVALPPAKGTCPVCATAHHPQMPHNQQSLYYQMTFHGQHGRWPTWVDAAKHCPSEMREYWFAELRQRGVRVGDEPEAKA